MAEIEIEKKKPIWPWIIGLLILAALLYFFVFADKDNDDDVRERPVTTEQVTTRDTIDERAQIVNVSEVDEYKSYIQDPQMGVDHEYTHGALQKLIGATRAMARKTNVDIDADLSEASKKADEITKDPTATNHSKKIKSAAETITKALKTIQTEKTPNLDSEYKQVESTLALIDSDVKTLDQKKEIKAFFDSAGNLLTQIEKNYGQER